ncbi:uncharacterized protein LOC117602113 [Osmia lignaria lignaria]|uniref:uncharacterized protein LOC117602113 n=1 Tax=Osmia lignaria lignaria TaxID=1437193 RepID=UPI00402BB80B
MAPHIPRDYHSIGDPGKYSLRTIKTSENCLPAVSRLHLNTSEIRGKEDFLFCMGLQKRRSKHQYTAFNGNCSSKTVNIPAGVMLRDCRVVILGASCNICGRYFKCKTDLDVHIKFRHTISTVKNITTTSTQCTEYNEIIKIFPDSFKPSTITVKENVELKIRKKLQLTIRIGEEVVVKIPLKRKHLRMKAIDATTQTESCNIAELKANKDGYENSVSHIDPLLFCNSPYQCCDPTLRVANSTNQYPVSNNVTCKDSVDRENIALNRSAILNDLTVEPYLMSSSNSKEKDDDVILLTNDINSLSGNINKNKEQTDINAVEVLMIDISSEKQSQKIINSIHEDAVVPELHLGSPQHQSTPLQQPTSRQQLAPLSQPPVLPQQLSTHLQQSTPLQQSSIPQQIVSKESSRDLRRSEPTQQSLSPLSTLSPQSAHLQQSSTPSQRTTTPFDQTPGNEIQEVLRIVRGYGSSEDINHESPNRFEQELLLRDVIEEMKKQELRLLEEKNARKRKQPAKTNGLNNESSKKKKTSVQSSEKSTKPSEKKKCISNTTDRVAKTQNQNGASVGDILKENLINCNGNINGTNEMLRKYGIYMHNDEIEINNNTENIQELDRHFVAPCSAGMENRGNKPIVIDLVNDE